MTLFLAGPTYIFRASWMEIIGRAALWALAIIALVYFIQVVIPRLFPPRCPECRTRLAIEKARVYEGETSGSYYLPPVTFIRHSCRSCHYDRRELVPEELGVDGFPPQQRYGTALATAFRSRAGAPGAPKSDPLGKHAARERWSEVMESLKGLYFRPPVDA